MVQLIKNRDLYGISLFLLLVVMIGWQEMVSPAIGIFILVLLTEGFILKNLQFRLSRLNLLFVLFFLLYLVGIAWSEHQETGWKLLEYKMSFFIFPVLFLFPKSKTEIWHVLNGLIIGSVLLSARIFWIYFQLENKLSEYEISNTIIEIHPTYACIYLTAAIGMILIRFIYLKQHSRSEILKLHFILTQGAISIIFLFIIYRLGSFAGLLFLGLLLTIGLCWIAYQKFKLIGLLVVMIGVPTGFVFAVLKMDRFAYDIEMTKAVFAEVRQGKEFYIQKNLDDNSGTKMRVLLWFLSAEIIAENPFGVGTGDIDFHVREKCDKYNLKVLKEKNLNPHNQFFQTGIDIGIPGILVLASILIFNFVRGLKTKNILLIFFVLSLSFNAAFESVLQKQSGIVFYSCLICLAVAYEARLGNQKSHENTVV